MITPKWTDVELAGLFLGNTNLQSTVLGLMSFGVQDVLMGPRYLIYLALNMFVAFSELEVTRPSYFRKLLLHLR